MRKREETIASNESTRTKARQLALVLLVLGCPACRPRTDQPAQPTKSASSSVIADEQGSILQPTDAAQARWDEQLRKLNPANDGWRTEELADKATALLKGIAKVLQDSAGTISASDFDEMVTPQFRCGILRPSDLKVVFQDGSVVVRRPSQPPGDSLDMIYTGPEGMAVALGDFAHQLRDATGVRVSFKTFQVAVENATLTISSFFELTARRAQRTDQHNAVWISRWQVGPQADVEMVSIEVHDYEQVVYTSTMPTLLSDCTESVLGGNPSYHAQLRYGAGYWMRRLESNMTPRLLEAHMGVSVGDVNGDGLDDMYVCQPGGLPNLLFLQQPDGTARDVSSDSGVDILDWSYASLLIDLDNDGHQDLVVLTGPHVLLFRGDGRGRFAVRARLSGGFEYALTAADYDCDGDLDLYFCNYFAKETQRLSQNSRTDPLFDSNGGGANALYRNNGGWSFTNVTSLVGLDQNNRRLSYAAAWDDYNNDGLPDLYVANDFGHNNLYRNNGGAFTDVAKQAGVVDANFGMSTAWGDYNHDGQMDIYVSNMFSSAGNRVTFQPQFMSGSAVAKSAVQQLARGNTLLENCGDGTFRDVSVAAGVTMGRWAWASLFVDLNNDSWDDILVTNGYLTQDTIDDL